MSVQTVPNNFTGPVIISGLLLVSDTINDVVMTNGNITASSITTTGNISCMDTFFVNGVPLFSSSSISPTNQGVPLFNIPDQNIINRMIAPSSIDSNILALSNVTASHILNSNIIRSHIVNKAVGSNQIDDAAIYSNHLSPRCVTSTSISPQSINTTNVVPSAITTICIADNNVTTGKIATGAVTSTQLNSNLAFTGSVNMSSNLLTFSNGSDPTTINNVVSCVCDAPLQIYRGGQGVGQTTNTAQMTIDNTSEIMSPFIISGSNIQIVTYDLTQNQVGTQCSIYGSHTMGSDYGRFNNLSGFTIGNGVALLSKLQLDLDYRSDGTTNTVAGTSITYNLWNGISLILDALGTATLSQNNVTIGVQQVPAIKNFPKQIVSIVCNWQSTSIIVLLNQVIAASFLNIGGWWSYNNYISVTFTSPTSRIHGIRSIQLYGNQCDMMIGNDSTICTSRMNLSGNIAMNGTNFVDNMVNMWNVNSLSMLSGTRFQSTSNVIIGQTTIDSINIKSGLINTSSCNFSFGNEIHVPGLYGTSIIGVNSNQIAGNLSVFGSIIANSNVYFNNNLSMNGCNFMDTNVNLWNINSLALTNNTQFRTNCNVIVGPLTVDALTINSGFISGNSNPLVFHNDIHTIGQYGTSVIGATSNYIAGAMTVVGTLTTNSNVNFNNNLSMGTSTFIDTQLNLWNVNSLSLTTGTQFRSTCNVIVGPCSIDSLTVNTGNINSSNTLTFNNTIHLPGQLGVTSFGSTSNSIAGTTTILGNLTTNSNVYFNNNLSMSTSNFLDASLNMLNINSISMQSGTQFRTNSNVIIGPLTVDTFTINTGNINSSNALTFNNSIRVPGTLGTTILGSASNYIAGATTVVGNFTTNSNVYFNNSLYMSGNTFVDSNINLTNVKSISTSFGTVFKSMSNVIVGPLTVDSLTVNTGVITTTSGSFNFVGGTSLTCSNLTASNVSASNVNVNGNVTTNQVIYNNVFHARIPMNSNTITNYNGLLSYNGALIPSSYAAFSNNLNSNCMTANGTNFVTPVSGIWTLRAFVRFNQPYVNGNITMLSGASNLLSYDNIASGCDSGNVSVTSYLSAGTTIGVQLITTNLCVGDFTILYGQSYLDATLLFA